MARTISREGIELRLKIRTEKESNPDKGPAEIRRMFRVTQQIYDSAMNKTADEWQTALANFQSQPSITRKTLSQDQIQEEIQDQGTRVVMPGLEQGVIKFTRKPAKMGDDYIFWIPRVYLRNGLVDPNQVYEVHLLKIKEK